jgi:hypothetical protein
MSLVDKGEDVTESDAFKRRGAKRKRAALIVGAGAVVAAGAVVIVRAVSGDDKQSTTAATETTLQQSAADPTPIEPELSGRLLFDPVPDGFVVQYLNEAGTFGPAIDVPAAGPTLDVSLLRAPDATLDDGAWLSASVSLLDRFERQSFEPMNYVDPSQFRKTSVNGLNGVVGKNWDDSLALVFGPANDGFVVSLASAGITEQELLAIAAEITLEENGLQASPQFGPSAAEAGLEPFMRYPVGTWGGVSVGLQLPLLGGDGNSTNVGYVTEEGFDEYVTITNTPFGEDVDMLGLAEFAFSEFEQIEVRGMPAAAGKTPESLGEQPTVVWAEGGRLIVVSGSPSLEDLVSYAQTVVVADDDAWAEAVKSSQEFQGVEQFVADAWLIGVGDFEDSTTWTIEGGFDDDGNLVLCSLAMSVNGGSSSGCAPGVEIAAPQLLKGPSMGFGGPDNRGATVVAVGIPGEVLILRFTPDDGPAVEVPLREIRPDWPVWAAAVGASGPGTVELVDGAGTVLDTVPVTDDDIGAVDGFAPAETVAPAAG